MPCKQLALTSSKLMDLHSLFLLRYCIRGAVTLLSEVVMTLVNSAPVCEAGDTDIVEQTSFTGQVKRVDVRGKLWKCFRVDTYDVCKSRL